MRSGVVLAGGKARRMKKDKALIDFRGRPLISYVLESMSGKVDEIAISVARGGRSVYSIFPGASIIEDIDESIGPLGGLRSSFSTLKGEYVAVAPCDSPLISDGFYDMLFRLVEGHDGAVPFVNGFFEPLHAVYRRNAMLEAIDHNYQYGKFKITDTYERLDICSVSEDIIRELDPQLRSFININTFEDLKALDMDLNPVPVKKV